MSDGGSPLREGIVQGVGIAIGFSMIAALPLGGLGIVLCVESARGSTLEMPWSGYGALLLIVFGSYFVAGFIGGAVFGLLRPLRAIAYGWFVTGAMLAVIGYGTMGIAIAAFYDQAGKYVLDHSSQADAWQMIPWMMAFTGLLAGCYGLMQWFQDPDSPRNVRARAAAARSTPVHPFVIVQRGYRRPSARVLLTVAALALAAWVRFTGHTQNATQQTDRSQASESTANSGIILIAGVSDSTDSVARQFIRMAQRHAFDSAGHLVSPTLHLQDSTLLVSAIASRLPTDTTIPLTRTVAERWTGGSVTRTIEAYAIDTPADSVTVVLQTIEEMGVRWIERAGVEHGSIRTVADAARASDSAAAHLAADTVSLMRIRK